jgi:sulfate adenylyltransferase large subunit
MTLRPDPEAFALDRFVRQQEQKSLLRFVVCGSVDHGKSTLIGRLLYESKKLFEDQVHVLQRDSRKHGGQDGELDFSLLLDGLAAEREQKITIDVAYRFFTTDRRKFIVADAPGHEQYTRNMATGASTADAALILVSAEQGLTRQTKRHAVIVATLGVRHLVVAVNKMDLVGWSKPAFDRIEDDFWAFAKDLDIDEIGFIPLAARSGDNVVHPSRHLHWYRGPTLLEHLEEVEIARAGGRDAFRMPIQWVNRPDAEFRGYSGLITAGEIAVGAPVQILPSGQKAEIARIVTFDGDLSRAFAGQSVTLTLSREVDASRGDVIAEIGRPASVTDRLTARVVWLGRDAFKLGRTYLLKLGTCTAKARMDAAPLLLDLDARTMSIAKELAANDIGQCVLRLDRQIAVDAYADARETGSFILIDPETFDTVGMGCVERIADDKRRLTRLLRKPLQLARPVGRALSSVARSWL